jgi:hypothetical protein
MRDSVSTKPHLQERSLKTSFEFVKRLLADLETTGLKKHTGQSPEEKREFLPHIVVENSADNTRLVAEEQ